MSKVYMSKMFDTQRIPCVFPLENSDYEVPTLEDQLKTIAIDRTVEDGIRARGSLPSHLKTLDTVFCGTIWGVPYALAYSPLLEGESKHGDNEWMCQHMLNILQADYLKMRQRQDPTNQHILTYKTICDTWEPLDFSLTEEMYTHWRANYERNLIQNHLQESVAKQTPRKM